MEQMLHTYGKTLLAILMTGILLAWIFWGIEDDKGNQGILRIAGANVRRVEAHPEEYREFDGYLSEGVCEKPVITYCLSGSLRTGAIDLCDCIRAVDYVGNELPITVTNCTNPAAMPLTPYDGQTGYIFEEPGIYTVEVSAIDEGRRKTACRIQIPVQRNL